MTKDKLAEEASTLDAHPALSHIRQLEAESIHIIREVASEFQKPVMLYSIGKDSSVMLRLAQKAFYPATIPFPLLHIDTGYKFREMLEFRDRYTAGLGLQLIVWRNEEALAEGANPVALGTSRCCGLLKTQALLDGLRSHDAVRWFSARASAIARRCCRWSWPGRLSSVRASATRRIPAPAMRLALSLWLLTIGLQLCWQAIALANGGI